MPEKDLSPVSHNYTLLGLVACEGNGQHSCIPATPQPSLKKPSRIRVTLNISAGMAEYVTLIEGDALQTIDSIDGPFFFVFIDAVKAEYVFSIPLFGKDWVGGLVAADYMLSHKALFIMDAYKGFIRLMEDASTVSVPIGTV